MTDIVVTNSSTCPNGTDLVFSKPWYGSRQACYCFMGGFDAFGDSINSHVNEKVNTNQYMIGRSCTSDEMNKKNCYTIPARNPVIMGQFNGRRVCGKRGGNPFIDAVRV